MAIQSRAVLASEAKALGYAKFNNGEHLCVDGPDGNFTISVRLSNGEQVTFAFCPYGDNQPAKCVDVQRHTSPRMTMNGNQELPIQQVICFTCGSDTFRSSLDDKKPTTLMTVLLH